MKALLGLLALLLATSVPAAVTWHGRTAIAEGGGEKGPWRQNESRYDYVDDPAVALDEDGEAAIAWVDQARKDVFFQRFSAAGDPRGQPINVSRTPETFSWLPRVVITPRDPGKVFLLWQEIIFSGGSHGGDILFARSEDGGVSFAAPINLSSSAGGDGKGRINKDLWHNGSLDLAAGADGAVYAAWTEYDGALWLSVSSDHGRTFTRARHIAGDGAKPARAPSLAIGPERTLYLAWTLGEDRSADIHLARSRDGGLTFSDPRIVARTSGHSDAPKLAVDLNNALHLAWAESSNGPFERRHILYMRSLDGARSFEPPRRISGEGAAFPSLEVDAQGNPTVIWELFRARHEARGLGFAVSRDGGKTFTAPGAVPGSADPAGGPNGSHQGLLMRKLAVNGDGAVAVVNSSLQKNEGSRVWLMRGALPR
jgi:hypothetical protein